MPNTRQEPDDGTQSAKAVMDRIIHISEGELMGMKKDAEERIKNPHAQALSKLGASKGGLARAKSLSAAQRKKIAKSAARARWGG